MSLKPKSASRTGGGDYEPRNYPEPKPGARRARVSLIVQLGTQEREDFDAGKPTAKPQKPAEQIAIFADLVNDVVDYGGDIGEAQYRLPLNGTFKGVFKGINFYPVPPKDGDGNTIKGKEWGLHDNSIITKLAKAVGKPEVQWDMDVSELLDEQFMATVEVKKVPSGKEDDDGNEIVYTNVNYKGAAMVAPVINDETGDESIPTFAKLRQKARCITFENATVEDIKILRSNLIKIIKLAEEYPGSNIQKAIEAFEKEKGIKPEPAEEKTAPKKAATKPAKEKAPVAKDDGADDDAPF